MWARRMIVGLVSFALLAGAIVLSYDPPVVIVGKGTGENAQIRSIEDMSDVLQSLKSLGEAENAMTLSLDSGENAAQRYSSVTVTENTNMLSDRSHSEGDYSSSSYVSFRRKLQIALTSNAAYYVSEGQMISRSSSEQTVRHTLQNGQFYSTTTERESKIFLDFSINIYMSASYVLLKVNRLEYSSYDYYKYINSSDSDKNEEKETWDEDQAIMQLGAHLGQWIDCSSDPDVAKQFLSINESNIQTLGSIGDFVEDAVHSEDSPFQQTGDLYTVDERGLLALFGLSSDNGLSTDSFRGSLNIDLSSAETPSIVLDMSNSVSGTDSLKASIHEAFYFENIDNTVIRLADNIDAVDLTDILKEEL